MNVLKYVKKRDFEEGADCLFAKRIVIAIKHNGEECKKCGHVQGESKRGFDNYYCKHLRSKITNDLKKEKRKINKDFFEFITLTLRSNIEVKV